MPASSRPRKRKEPTAGEETAGSQGGPTKQTPPPSRAIAQHHPANNHPVVLYCGTSGYSYAHWNNGAYYPRGYSTRQWEYYSSDCFDAVELNATFYRWQKPETWLAWRERVVAATAAKENDRPRRRPFIYAVKAHQYFTHWRRLAVDDAFASKFRSFGDDCRRLGRHLGPLLLQFSSRFECNETTLARLRQFGQLVRSMNSEAAAEEAEAEAPPPLRVALEFRHRSWFEAPEVMSIAREYDLCICLVHLVNRRPARWADNMRSGFSPPLDKYPFQRDEGGCTWGVYARFHGTTGQYEGSYSDDFLDEFVGRCENVPNLYMFFNNTDSGTPPSAIRDAKYICRSHCSQC